MESAWYTLFAHVRYFKDVGSPDRSLIVLCVVMLEFALDSKLADGVERFTASILVIGL